MYMRIVTFGITIPEAEYHALAGSVAEAFTHWPGPVATWWLNASASGTYGGVYLFDDRAAADASRGTPQFAALAENPVFTDLSVREFDLIEGLTAITASRLVPAA